MKTCFGYVRVSTVKQGEGVSLEAQKEAIEAFAGKNDITITKWFQEKETAAKRGRPVFGGMLRELKKRHADGVVMHKIDRSARNFADWAKIGELSDAGIDVHFASESLDFRTRGGRLAADIQAVIAADYIRNLREETVKGLYGRLKQGIYPFKAPIGYLDHGGGKVKTIDPVRGPLVKRAFDFYASGQYSIRALQAELQRLGLATRSGKPLSKGGVEKMLANPFYTGVMRVQRNGATFRGTHEPLISASTFQAVQDVKAGKAVKKITRHNHTYRGLFRCRACGNGMIAERQKGHVYYRCQQTACPTNCIREEALVEAAKKVFDKSELPKEVIPVIVDAVEAWASKHLGTVGAQAPALQLRQLESRLDHLTDALIDRLIDKETFNRRKEAMLIEMAGLEKQLADTREKAISSPMIQLFLERVLNLAEHYIFALPAGKREIVSIATSNRSVWSKTAYLEPSNWLRPTYHTLSVFYCGHYRAKHRRTPKLQDEHIEALVTAGRSEEFAHLNAVLERCEQSRAMPSDEPTF